MMDTCMSVLAFTASPLLHSCNTVNYLPAQTVPFSSITCQPSWQHFAYCITCCLERFLALASACRYRLNLSWPCLLPAVSGAWQGRRLPRVAAAGQQAWEGAASASSGAREGSRAARERWQGRATGRQQGQGRGGEAASVLGCSAGTEAEARHLSYAGCCQEDHL